MTEISTEELAQWLESIMIGPLCMAPLTNAEYNACSDALTEAAARLRALAEDAERYQDALQDMLSGWKYIREQHGDLYGVGWDRAQQKAESAIDKARHD